MGSALQDLRYTLRTWARSPGFAAIAAVTLAIGIGANTAIFSVVNAVLMRPLPYSEPQHLVRLYDNFVERGLLEWPASLHNFLDWRDRNRSFQEMAAWQSLSGNLTAGVEPKRVIYTTVSQGFFRVLQTSPALGRAFLPEEGLPGSDSVVVLAHGFWLDQFGGDEAVIGDSLELHGERCTVVGVMPPGFGFPDPDVALWKPLVRDTSNPLERGRHYLNVIARVKPDVSPAQAGEDMDRVAAGLALDYPDQNEGATVTVRPLQDAIVADSRPVLFILWGAVTLVLLIACSNVSNLLLVRTSSRRRELAIRTALGAGRLRLVRQLLTESLLLCVVSGTTGVLLAFWSIRWLAALASQTLGTTGEIRLDGQVLAFTILATLFTGLLTGLAPAIRSSRTDPNGDLKEAGRTLGGSSGRRTRNALVVAEVGMALILVVGAGLLVRSFAALTRSDAGFDSRNVLTFRLSLPTASYPTAESTRFFHAQLAERLEALPPVEAVSSNILLPLEGPFERWGFALEGREEVPAQQAASALLRQVTPGYLKTMRIPVLRGRSLASHDGPDGQKVVVISEALARRYWPGEDPIGRRINFRGMNRMFFGPDSTETTWWTIVGITGEVPDSSLADEPNPVAYMPLEQYPVALRTMSVAVRTQGDPSVLAGAIRAEIAALDRNLPLFNVRSMEQVLGDSMGRTRLLMMLIGAFAGVALALGLLGIYHEIGVRMAMGARPRDVLRAILGQGVLLAGAGIGAGLVGAFALTRYMESLLFGVTTNDLATFTGAAALLLAVALLATWLPARRASGVNPVTALRHE
jgi:putative ABC transport system permease protein